MKRPNKTGGVDSKPAHAPDFVAINAALEKHLELTSTEMNQSTLKRRVGDEGFATINEIIAFAGNQDAWLQANNLSAAADQVSGRLSQHYPLLSQLAIFKIVNQATYGWR